MTQEQSIKVTFEPTGRSAWVLPGTTVLEAAGQCGLSLDTPCGGAGTCGKCRVRFIEGAPDASQTASEHLSAEELAAGWRLACQAKIERPAVVSIPTTSLFAERMQILTESEQIVEISQGEPPHKVLPVPIVTGRPNFAVAFDVGTTTLVGEMLDLPSGHERAVAACVNPQVSFGDDVVSRIGRANHSAAAADELRQAVVGALNELLDELCVKADVRREHVRALSFSGNTTMQHLLCGLDVANLAHLPFQPSRKASLELPAEELGFPAGAGARAYVMPVIGGFIGGDTVSGILAARLGEERGPVLMLDIGTNGEIVLAEDGRLRAASAAAGPAFEGARIACGMRAAEGAVEKVALDGDLQLSVIGGGEPIGICGSALVDAAAELLRGGLLEATGRLLGPENLAPTACAALRKRLRRDAAGEVEFVLWRGQDGRPDVVLKQRDMRELQLATGALRTGVSILLKQAGRKATDLKRVLIAGGFGSFIRRRNAQRIGLIPAETPPERVTYVGNVSLHGAKWVLVSTEARRRAEALAVRTEHVELSADPDFQMTFADSMMFPET